MYSHAPRTINTKRLLNSKFCNYSVNQISVAVDNLACENSCVSNLDLDFHNSANSGFSVLGYSSSDLLIISSLQVMLEACHGINDTVQLTLLAIIQSMVAHVEPLQLILILHYHSQFWLINYVIVAFKACCGLLYIIM